MDDPRIQVLPTHLSFKSLTGWNYSLTIHVPRQLLVTEFGADGTDDGDVACLIKNAIQLRNIGFDKFWLTGSLAHPEVEVLAVDLREETDSASSCQRLPSAPLY